MSKVVTKIRTTIKSLEVNGVLSNTLMPYAITALCNNALCKDHRIDVKSDEKDHNCGNSVELQAMLTALEKKYILL